MQVCTAIASVALISILVTCANGAAINVVEPELARDLLPPALNSENYWGMSSNPGAEDAAMSQESGKKYESRLLMIYTVEGPEMIPEDEKNRSSNDESVEESDWSDPTDKPTTAVVPSTNVRVKRNKRPIRYRAKPRRLTRFIF